MPHAAPFFPGLTPILLSLLLVSLPTCFFDVIRSVHHELDQEPPLETGWSVPSRTVLPLSWRETVARAWEAERDSCSGPFPVCALQRPRLPAPPLLCQSGVCTSALVFWLDTSCVRLPCVCQRGELTLSPSQHLSVADSGVTVTQFPDRLPVLGEQGRPQVRTAMCIVGLQSLLSLVPHMTRCLPASWRSLLGGCPPHWNGYLPAACS